MASAHAHIHLSVGDKPAAELLESGNVALWLTALASGPVISGSPAQLQELNRALGRFLFPDQCEQPEWRDIASAPRDAVVLVAVEPGQQNDTFRNSGRVYVHPAYVDEDGRLCSAESCKPSNDLDGSHWKATRWAPLPASPAPTVTRSITQAA